MTTARRLSSKRFEVRGELGKGGLGVVYDAFDRETQGRVALKMLLNPSPERLYWLKNEFRRIADLQHPNLVQIGALHNEGGTCFISMELIRGIDLRSYVRGRRREELPDATATLAHLSAFGALGGPAFDFVTGSHPGAAPGAAPAEDTDERERSPDVRPRACFDETRLRDAFRQLADGVCALHAVGLVHRDLKHSNVMVEEGGRVVLLDFGLTETQRDSAARGAGGGVCGTAAFMAPEQVDASGAEEAFDWYAFGVMLFDALTGRLPFEGTSREMLASKRAVDAPSPSEYVDGVPADLEELCRALLARDPRARPSGEEVRRRLAGHGAVQQPREKLTRTFVGREAQLAALDAALAEVSAGRHAAVLVEGEPGVGKTELVERFIASRLSRERGAIVLRGRCYEQEFIPFKGLDTVLDGLASYLQSRDDAAVRALLPARLDAATALFPALYRVPAVARIVPPPSMQEIKLEQREAAFAELSQLVRALSREALLVFFLDDLQWAGSDTEALLEALFGDSPPPALLIATRRSTNDWSGQLVTENARPRSSSARLFRVLPLLHLSTAESAALVQELWPAVGAQRSQAELEAFLAEGDGHPLFLQEMARYASLGGARRHALRLDQVLRERIVALPQQARALVEVCAVAGVPLPEQVLARVAGISHVDSVRSLRALRSEQLVRTSTLEGAPAVESYHDRIREAIIDGIRSGDYTLVSAPSLPAAHLALGRQLLRARDERLIEVPFSTIANHYNQGATAFDQPDDARIATELNLRAMRQVKIATAFAAAEHYLLAGRGYLAKLGAAEARGLRRSFDFEEMELAHLSNDSARMEARFRGLVSDSANEGELADAYERKVTLLSARSQHHEALGVARECLARLGSPLAAKGNNLALLRDVAKLELALRGRAVADIARLPELRDELSHARMRILMAMTPASYFTDSTLMCIAMVRMAQISLEGLTDFSAYGFAAYAMVLSGAFRSYKRAFQFSQLALTLNERFENRALNTKLPFLCGIFTAPYQCSFDEAHSYLKQALEHGVGAGDLNFTAYSAVSIPMVTLCAGKSLSQAGREADSAVRDAERVAALDMTYVARWQVRMIRCLEGATPDPTIMDAPSSTELECKAETIGHHPMASFYYALNKSLLAYHFDDRETSEEWIEKAHSLSYVQFGLLSIVDFTFYRMLVSSAAFERARGLRARARWYARIATTTMALRIWGRVRPENFGAHYLLARAERARIRGHLELARRRFEHTIAEAERLERHRVAAVAWERLADCHTACGRSDEAERCRRRAALAYTAWGAHAKARALGGEAAGSDA